jgi:hypothetical protein
MRGIAHRPLSDMESNGVYFEMDELLLLGDESFCQYSGLPSVKAYEEKQSQTINTNQYENETNS